MADREIVLSQATILEALQSEPVRAELREKAYRIANKADDLADRFTTEAEVWVEEDTRPKGRPVARVMCDNVDQEWGTSKTTRRRILGTAAEGER